MTELIKETCSYGSKKPVPIEISHVVVKGRDYNVLMNYCPIDNKVIPHYQECHVCQYLREGGD